VKIVIFVENRNFLQNRSFGYPNSDQKSKFWPKNPNFDRKSQFCQKLKFSVEIEIFSGTQIIFTNDNLRVNVELILSLDRFWYLQLPGRHGQLNLVINLAVRC